MVFVGYEPRSKAYRVYDPTTRRVHISRDVVFDEATQWTWSAEDDGEPGDFTVEAPAEDVISTVSSAAPLAAALTPAQDSGATTSSSAPSHGVEFASPPGPSVSELLDNDHDDDAPLRFRRVDNVIGPGPTPGLAARDLEEHLLLACDAEPSSLDEALKHECWRHALLDEMTAIEANGTWELVDPPPRIRPIGLKWVYKAKKDAVGFISKYKARLVAKGYVQRQGIDFNEVFAPVARLESVRLLLAHAANEGWAVHHMDVKSASLNGELREEVYVEQPPGFVLKGHEGKVLHLIKVLYGLRQAPRAWYAKIDSSLLGLGFQRSNSEHTVYLRGDGVHRLVVGVYVDDLVITGGNASDIDKFKSQMKATF
jgi:hypothetical protein